MYQYGVIHGTLQAIDLIKCLMSCLHMQCGQNEFAPVNATVAERLPVQTQNALSSLSSTLRGQNQIAHVDCVL